MRKVGILGSGVVGQSLANGFLKHGYQVMVASRDLSKLADWKEQAGENGSIGAFDETAAFGDVVVLAVQGSAAKDAIELAGPANLAGKTIIDTCNPIADAPPEHGLFKFFTDLDNSLLEQLQSAFPDLRFVKAFSSVGYLLFVNPDFGGIRPSMFICGNDESAKDEVSGICELFGWDTEDMGRVEAARAIEPLGMLWCIPGLRENKWNHAFKLLKN